MRTLLVAIFCLITQTITWCQGSFSLDNPTDLFYFNKKDKYVAFQDSAYQLQDSSNFNFIHGAHDYLSGKTKIYVDQNFVHLKNGNTVSIETIFDTTFLFREVVKKNGEYYDSIISVGELKVDPSRFNVIDYLLTDSHGEDSLVIDTNYFFMKQGIWTETKNKDVIENGHYVNGQRNGIWLEINSRLRYHKLDAIVAKNAYKNGKLIQSEQFDLSKNLRHLEKNIQKEWFNVGMNVGEIAICRYGECLLTFVTDSTKFRPSYYGIHDYLLLNKDHTCESRTSVSCGVGFKQDTKPKLWKINEEQRFFVGEQEFVIEYLSEDMLILKYVFE